MSKKKSNNGRKFFTCEVSRDGKKIKFPKKLRNKITSYRRIGYGPNERDVLIGEVVNDKYLVFPLYKEMDLDNSELYIIERTPHGVEDEPEKEETSTSEESKDDTPDLEIVNVSETLYKPLGLRKVSSIPNEGLFKYDDMIWIKRRPRRRTCIETLDGSLVFTKYISKKFDCTNPYRKINRLMVEQVSAVSPEEENNIKDV